MSTQRLTTTAARPTPAVRSAVRTAALDGGARRGVTVRRSLAVSAVTATAALVLTPTAAFAAGGPGGKPVPPVHKTVPGTGAPGKAAPGAGAPGKADYGHDAGSVGKPTAPLHKPTAPLHKAAPGGPSGGAPDKPAPAGNPADKPADKPAPAGSPADKPGPSDGKAGPAAPAGGPGGKPTTPHKPTGKPAPAGPIQTSVHVTGPKTPSAAKTLTLSAHVSPARRGGPGTPAESGTVVFTIDGTPGTPVSVASARASEKIKLPAGSHTVSAKYSGDAAHAGSDSGPVTITVS